MDVVTAQRFHSSGVQPLRNVSCLLTGQGRFWLQGKPVLGRAAVQQVSVPTVEDCPSLNPWTSRVPWSVWDTRKVPFDLR